MKFTQKLFDEICDRLSGGESLRTICAGTDMPSREAVRKWLAGSEELVAQYARAREAQADHIFDEILEIADDSRNDWMAGNAEDASDVLNSENIQRSRLRIDARKWMAGKLRPKVYGDKIEVDNKHDLSDPMVALLEHVAGHGKRIGDS